LVVIGLAQARTKSVSVLPFSARRRPPEHDPPYAMTRQRKEKQPDFSQHHHHHDPEVEKLLHSSAQTLPALLVLL
jgi:hypothetical protein